MLLAVVVVDVLIDPVSNVANVLFDPVDGVFHARAAVWSELALNRHLCANYPQDAGQH